MRQTKPSPPPAQESTIPATPEVPVADRGWYLAVEYGTLPGKDDFQRRLEALRELGTFKELLEAGGVITYRNLFREDQTDQAWKLLTALDRWKRKVRLYLCGEPVAWSDARDIVWCAGFLQSEQPCRGDLGTRSYDVGCAAKVSFAPFAWDRRDDSRRHILTFARLDPQGSYVFDLPALLAFLLGGVAARLCPASPARRPEAWERALAPPSLQELGWKVSLRLPEAERASLGRSFERDQAYSADPEAPSLVGPVPLELRLVGGAPAVFKVQADGAAGPRISRGPVDLDARVRKVLERGWRLRGRRKGERYAREAGRRNEIEQVFHIEDAFSLEAGLPVADYAGYDLEGLPDNTDGYRAWAQRALDALLLRT